MTANGQAQITRPAQPIRSNIVPADRRVPIVEIDSLLLKTITVVTDGPIPAIQITRAGGPAVSTLNNWEKHRVRSPLLRTIRSALRACGYSMQIVDKDGTPV